MNSTVMPFYEVPGYQAAKALIDGSAGSQILFIKGGEETGKRRLVAELLRNDPQQKAYEIICRSLESTICA